jgi:hypothetical protein
VEVAQEQYCVMHVAVNLTYSRNARAQTQSAQTTLHISTICELLSGLLCRITDVMEQYISSITRSHAVGDEQ